MNLFQKKTTNIVMGRKLVKDDIANIDEFKLFYNDLSTIVSQILPMRTWLKCFRTNFTALKPFVVKRFKGFLKIV